MPIAGAAISSSRVATAKRPTRASRKRLTTISAPSAATHSHVFVVEPRHARQPAGAAGQLLPVLHGLVDDEQDGERDHRRRQPAGPGDGDADERAERRRRRRRPTDGRGDRAELDVAEPERQVGQACSPSSPRGWRRSPCRRRRSGRRPGGRTTGCPVEPDEHLQSEHEHEVDEQLLHEQVAGRPARRRVDDGAGDERRRTAPALAAALRPTANGSAPSHPLRRCAR